MWNTINDGWMEVTYILNKSLNIQFPEMMFLWHAYMKEYCGSSYNSHLKYVSPEILGSLVKLIVNSFRVVGDRKL